jgi:uncharacterized protein (DUF1800 family)
MGDQNTILAEGDARHLLRRAGFAPTKKELTTSGLTGMTRGAAADKVLGYKIKKYRPGGADQQKQHAAFMRYLLTTKIPAQEKLTLFWHDHFSTAIAKLLANNFGLATKLMGNQSQLLRTMAKGNMKDFVKAIARDAAMMEFLDIVRSEKSIPNENFARELMELFTLGVLDNAGNPNYEQADIVQIARAFSGWRYSRTGKPFLDEDQHDFKDDFPERGPKEIFGRVSGIGQFAAPQAFDANGEGEPEGNTVIDILFAHRDTDDKNTIARRTARRLMEFYVGPNPSLATIDAVVTASGFDSNFVIQGLVRAIFCTDDFYDTADPFGAGVVKSVKWPVDYAISTMRLLGMKFAGSQKYIPGGSFTGILTQMENMGQIVFDPPSVFGWDWETSWLSSSTLLARYNFASDIVASRGGGKLNTAKLVDFDLTDAGQIVDQVLDVLDVAHNFTAADRQVCIDYLTDSGALTPDLNDYQYQNTKLHGLFELVMKSPGYQVF